MRVMVLDERFARRERGLLSRLEIGLPTKVTLARDARRCDERRELPGCTPSA